DCGVISATRIYVIRHTKSVDVQKRISSWRMSMVSSTPIYSKKSIAGLRRSIWMMRQSRGLLNIGLRIVFYFFFGKSAQKKDGINNRRHGGREKLASFGM